MRALLDTCIIVDALQHRVPFANDAQTIFLLSANCRFEGFLTANSITDIYYLTHRQTHNDKETRTILTKLFTLFQLMDTTATDLRNALFSETSDYEDAVMIATAVRSDMDCIVTRNIKDYDRSPLPVCTPADFIRRLTEEQES